MKRSSPVNLADLWRLAESQHGLLKTGLLFRVLQGLFRGVPVVAIYLVVHDVTEDTLTRDRAALYSLIAIGAVFCELACSYMSNVRMWTAAYNLGEELRERAIDHAARLPMSYYAGKQTGDTTTVIVQDIRAIESFVSWVFPILTAALILPLCVLMTLALVDPYLGLVLTGALGVSIPVLAWSLRWHHVLADERLVLMADVTSRIIEYVQGVSVLRAFSATGERFDAFGRALRDFKAINDRQVRRAIPAYTAFHVALDLGVALLLAAGAYRLSGGHIDAGVMIVFLVLAMRLYQPLLEMADRAASLVNMSASLRRIVAFLDEPVPEEPQTSRGPARFDVTFSNVSFGYEPGREVLHDVSLTAAPKTMTAIVGPSGSGKTTILNLVARFWQANSGSVRIGGVDVTEMRHADLYSLLTVVFQDVYLFHGTLRANILLGRPDATDAEIYAAARAANCNDFISSLPNGYDTVIGEGGLTLSGGERQRISIARALLKDAPIVLLDEATAAIDPLNENMISTALANLVAGKTLIVVAHRLATIRSADQIVVLQDGRITEQGHHEALLASGKLYAHLWQERSRAATWQVQQPGALSSVDKEA